MTGRPLGEDVRSPQRPPVVSWVSLTFPMCHDFLSFLPTADVSEGCLNYCGTPKEVAVPFVSRPRLALLPCGVSRSWGSQLRGLRGHRQRGQNRRRGDRHQCRPREGVAGSLGTPKQAVSCGKGGKDR